MITHLRRWGFQLSLLLIVGLLRPACGSLLPAAALQGNITICSAADNQILPRLVSDGGGGAFVFWIDRRSGNWNVFAQKLSPTGAPLWAADGIPITSTGTAWYTGLAAVSDGGGGAIVVWCDTRTVDASGIDLYAQRINLDGTSLWAAGGVSVLSTLITLEFPQAIPDGAGGAVILGQEDIYFSSPSMNVHVRAVSASGTSTWATGGALIVSNLNPYINTVRMISDNAGGAIVGWDGYDSTFQTVDNIYAQRVDSTGALLWVPGGVSVCVALSTQRTPDLAPDGSGGAICAWSDRRNSATTGYDIYAQRLNSLGQPQWTIDGVAVADRPGPQVNPRLASDGSGGAILVFSEPAADGFGDVYAQRISPTGSRLWGAPGVPICTTADEQSIERLVADGSGGAVIVWKDFRGHTSYDLYAQWIDSAAAIRWAPNGARVSIAAYDQTTPDVLPLASDRAFFAWNDHRSDVATSDVYAQVLLLDGSASPALPTVTPSTPWSAFNWPVSPFEGNVIDLHGIPDGSGGAILIWTDQRPNAWGIYLQRIGPTGLPLWNPSGIPLVTGPSMISPSSIASDGAGGAIVVWQQDQIGTLDLYAQRVAPDGSSLWASPGVPVVEQPGDQRNPQIVPDGAGGAIIVWEDLRAWGSNSIDLYAQRLDSLGNRLWNTQGIAVSATTANETAFQILPDGAAGIFVVWVDDRNSATTQYDVFAQRVGSAGTLPWGGPVSVCAAAGDQRYLVIVPDGAGGLIAAWADQRSGPTIDQIFGQRLNSSGVPQWTTNGVLVNPFGAGSLQMIADGAGGAILSCRGVFSSINAVFGIRIDSAGATPWPAGGVRLSQGDPAANIHAMLADGAGGAFVAWGDQGDRDLYLQRIDGAGALPLGSGGSKISTANNFQGYPILVPGSSGRVIAAWSDSRRGTNGSHLYAQGLKSDGTP